ncbi:MAG: VUT family protein, partial [Dehalococcoidia bacterium]
AGEFANSLILARMKVATNGRWLWSRTIGSTLVGQGLDTVLFISIAFSGTGIPDLPTLAFKTWVFKVGFEVLATPLTYVVVNTLKRLEGIDTYDRDVDFNPVAVWD